MAYDPFVKDDRSTREHLLGEGYSNEPTDTASSFFVDGTASSKLLESIRVLLGSVKVKA
jgi:hypothetical protein